MCVLGIASCKSEDEPKTPAIEIPETDISEEIVGEWVCDYPENNEWQSMKFISDGAFFCYSNVKAKWTDVLKNVRKGSYGVKGTTVSGSNGSNYLDMTVSKINGYEFTCRLNETTVDFKFNKVLMRTHLNYGLSVVPPYMELVDTIIIGYRSHDETLAVVDNNTGEITAVANNGRTYIDVITPSGTAVIKVMIGRVDDGDVEEISPVVKKVVTPVEPILNLPKAILGQWVYDKSYWEVMNFLEDGKVIYSSKDVVRRIYNANASGEYTIDPSNNRLTLNVQPTSGPRMTVIMAMTTISKYSFTAKFYQTDGSSNGSFTYAKLLGAIDLQVGETLQPNYEDYLEEGTVVTEFKSHSQKIVDVNSETGELTANLSGRTYIDVVTEDGTGVVEVNVK